MKKIRSILILVYIILLIPGCGMSDHNQDKTAKSDAVPLEIEKTYSEANEPQTLVSKTPTQEVPPPNGKLIVIDPGHSSVVAEGTEPLGPGSSEYKAADTGGTSGVSTGVPEYELTLSIAQKLKAELEFRGYRVLLTRESNDVPLSCTQRANVSNQNHADAFVRIHANGSENTDANGSMTICTTPSSPYVPALYASSRALSDSVITKLCENTGSKNDGVWETDSMSGNNWSQVPTTIVEMGYMTNPQEDQMMLSEEYQGKIVQGIANGINDYIF